MANWLSRSWGSRWAGLSAIACAAMVSVAGCGDAPVCQSAILVIIQSPSGVVATDSNVDMAGLQTDVVVKSTVPGGTMITLEVLDDEGEVLDTIAAEAGGDGEVTFEDVSLADGAARLRASADAGECGSDEDEVDIDVTGGDGCALALRQEPLDIDFYAPLGVLNASLDPDPDAEGFQADVDVEAEAGQDVELFVVDADGIETSVGVETADEAGLASFAVDLGEGRASLRAVCSRGAVSASSLTTTVLVDTAAPDCVMTNPVAGTTITPALDDDPPEDDGVQLTLELTAGGGDTAGEEATFTVTVDGTDTELPDVTMGADGTATAPATIDPATTPATVTIAVDAVDHAGNTCTLTEQYDVVYDGCAIDVVAPTDVVTEDADGNPSNGVQVDIDLQVSTECEGQIVRSDCGLDNPSGFVANDGTLRIRAEWCATSPCDVQDTCEFTVESPEGIETSTAEIIHYDDQPPSVTLQIVDPALTCPAQVTAADDVDGATPGVQITLRVVSPLATDRRLQQTDSTGTQIHDANAVGGNVTVTLQPGANGFVGIATDANGNAASTPSCSVSLEDIVVAFSAPAADGTVGAADGTVAGSDLTFDLCGTVSEAGASVEVTVGGVGPLVATVTGTTWCVTLTLAESPPTYTIVASATGPSGIGSATLILTVDLGDAPPITDLVVIADTRQSLEATWTAPDDNGNAVAGYIVRVSTTPLTDANFDTTGTIVPSGTPQAPGSTETLRTAPRRTGTAYWLGIASIDAAGNRSVAVIVGPVTPLFDRTDAILPPDTGGNAVFGQTMTRGKFNDDDFYDLAIGAFGADVGGHPGAGAVYVYFGGPAGIGDIPDVVIEGEQDQSAFGLSLAAVRWSSATRDDLVIGEPYSFNVDGRVYVFEGLITPGTYLASEAEIEIGVHPSANYFSGGALGWSLASLDFDGDGTDDLAIGDAVGGGGNGGVAIIYGGTTDGPFVNLSDTDASQLDGAVVHLIDDPNGGAIDVFGNYVFNVGPTASATDTTDDLLVNYADQTSGTNHAFVFRGTNSRPTTSAVHTRAFTVGQDVELVYATTDTSTEWGSSAGSIADQNGDGVRDIVIGAYRDEGEGGSIQILDGDTVGTAGVAMTSDPGVQISFIKSGDCTRLFGASIVNNATMPGADVDGDGQEDLIVTSQCNGIGQMWIWFGGSIPTGPINYSTSANHVISGPSTFNGDVPGIGGTLHASQWAGDVNGDGLADISWGDGTGNGADGSFVVLWDDGN
jgi:hypothetical protein